ncbi:MAG TPA: transporter [Parvularcula sp.]|nr:transporter [Parvularcula sp.]
MTGLIDAAFSRIRVVLTALLIVTIFGAFSYINIPREAEPDIPAPFVLVTLPLPGISPEDGERLLVRPTELELQSVEGLVQMDSLAYDGAAQIILEFATTIDVDQAVLDVREAVDRAKAEYPASAEEPVVTEFNIQNEFPILTTIIYGDAPERAIFRIAKRLEDALRSVGGVLEARLTGAREELLEIIVRPETLQSYGLTAAEVVGAVTANNQLVTAGAADFADGRFQVKAPGLIKTAADVRDIPVRVNGDRVVTVGDLAEVRRTFVDRQGYALFNGRPAIGVEITKRAGANIIETIEAAQKIVRDDATTWPASIRYEFLRDASVSVRDNLAGLTSSVLTAVFLVMIVIVAALGVRSALMVGVAIPTSFLMSFLFLAAFGVTLNLMVMFGLILAVGMLVDNAIVIVEYADRRMAEGAARREAYHEAARRMFWPVVTSTATTLAAFVPFLFWNDISGEFMKYLPITLIFVLSSSLVSALIFLPALGSVAGLPPGLKQRFKIAGKTGGNARVDSDDVDPLTLGGVFGGYARFLNSMIERPLLAMLASAAVLFVCYNEFTLASPDVEFFLKNDSEEINVLVLGRGNMSAAEKFAAVQEVAARIEGHEAIESIYLQTGPGLARSNDMPAETIGVVGVNLVPYSQRESSRVLTEKYRDMIGAVAGVVVEVRQREGGPPIGKDVQVEISGPSFPAMLEAARKTRAFVDEDTVVVNGQEVPTYMDQEDSLPLPGVEWSMEIDRALAGRYGLSVQEAGAMLQLVTDGLLVDKYRPDDADEEIDIRVRFPEEERSILGLDRIAVATPGGSVPLSNFVTREAKPQVDRVVRRDGKRIIEIKANGNTRVDGHPVSQDAAIAEVKAWLSSGALGDDIDWIIRGADEETNSAAQFFMGAMAAALFMIAMILLLQFNNFYHAGLTLTAVFFSVFGVLLGIALTGQYLSVIMTGVGIVALAGIVVNNNIIFIDTYQHLRRKGLAVRDAAVRAAVQRARPVLLTTGTTILGLLPMVFELNVDFAAGLISRGSTTSDWWVLLSSAVVYGLLFSTLLTLVLTPVLLAAPSVIGARAPAAVESARSLIRRILGRRGEPPAPLPPAPPANEETAPWRRAAE